MSSTKMMTLPLADEAPGRDERMQRITCRNGARPHVLLAEDSTAARIFTAALLRRMGCDVDAVEHGEEALALIQNFGYDLIILDIEMPVMDGVVAAKEIRALGGAAGRTPIVALSAFMADVAQSPSTAQIFDAALAKPATRDQLADAITAMLGGSARGKPSGKAPETLVDTERLALVRSQIPSVEWNQLLDTAIQELREISQAMAGGQKSGDLEVVLRSAHKLKGIASSFAALRLTFLARRLEQWNSSATNPLSEIVESVATCADRTAEALAAGKVA